jgi:ubiquinone/menaquinone biosynthesis C-methylase UbiE
MGQTPYDLIGTNYNRTRMADPRIVSAIFELLKLPPGSAIADIGAGTGNYSLALARLGYKILAIEPSDKMLKQAVSNENISWLQGFAEDIPLVDDSVKAVMIILALHHFSSMEKAIWEAARVCPSGPVVVFTMDPRESEEFWFNDYFPEIERQVRQVFPPIQDVIQMFCEKNGWSAQTRKFPLPSDLIDQNMCSGWNRPEIYLDKHFRQNMSGFALASQTEVEKGLKRLQRDLFEGVWNRENGYLRKQLFFNAGFRFIRFSKPNN